jgi:hypothetical protein
MKTTIWSHDCRATMKPLPDNKSRMVRHPAFIVFERGIVGCGERSEPHQSRNANGAVRA